MLNIFKSTSPSSWSSCRLSITNISFYFYKRYFCVGLRLLWRSTVTVPQLCRLRIWYIPAAWCSSTLNSLWFCMTKHWRFSGQALFNKNEFFYSAHALYFQQGAKPHLRAGGSLLLLQLQVLQTSKTHAALMTKPSYSPACSAWGQGGLTVLRGASSGDPDGTMVNLTRISQSCRYPSLRHG